MLSINHSINESPARSLSEFDDSTRAGRSSEDSRGVELGLYDVLCGRHKNSFNNIGNRRFRVTISLALDRYMSAPTRKAKSVVIKSVTAALIQGNGARFLRRRGGAWLELNEKQAHEKVGHALRDIALAYTKAEESSSFRFQAPIAEVTTESSSTEAIRCPAPSQRDLMPEDRPGESLTEATLDDLFERIDEPNGQPSFSDNEFLDFLTSASMFHIEDQHTTAITPSTSRRQSLDADMLSWLLDEDEFLLDAEATAV